MINFTKLQSNLVAAVCALAVSAAFIAVSVVPAETVHVASLIA